MHGQSSVSTPRTLWKARLTLLYLFLCLFSSFTLRATQPLRGQILDLSGQAIPQVEVYDMQQGTCLATSNAQGEFILTLPDSLQRITLSFVAEGFHTKQMELTPGEQVYRILLLPSERRLGEVVVRAHRLQQVTAFAPLSTQMTKMEILTSPRALGSILGAVSEAPEVQVSDTDGRLLVQGGAPGETQVYVDGLLLPSPYTLSSYNGGTRTTINPSACRRVRLFSGGYSAAYGEALSGVLLLETQEAREVALGTELSLSLLGGNISTTVGSPKAKVQLVADYTSLFLKDKLIPSSYHWRKSYSSPSLSASLFSELNGWQLKGQLSYSHMGFGYDRTNSGHESLASDLADDRWYARFTLSKAINSKLDWEAGGHIQYRDFRGSNLQRAEDAVKDRDAYAQLRSAIRWRITPILSLTSGIDYSYRDYHETYTYRNEYPLHFRNHLTALFSEGSLLYRGFTASVGLRGTYSSLLGESTLSPRLYAGYRFGKHLLAASWGYFTQLPSSDVLLFTPSLASPRAAVSQLSYGFTSGEHSLQLALFYKSYHGLMRRLSSSYPPSLDSKGRGESYGINLIYTGKIQALSYTLSYGFTEAKLSYDRFTHRVRPDYLSPHAAKASLRYWARSLSSMIGLACYLDAGATGYDASLTPISIPSRSRLDLSWTYVVSPRLAIHAGCQNILGTRNYWGFDPSYPASDPDGLRTTPSSRFVYVGLFFALGKRSLSI